MSREEVPDEVKKEYKENLKKQKRLVVQAKSLLTNVCRFYGESKDEVGICFRQRDQLYRQLSIESKTIAENIEGYPPINKQALDPPAESTQFPHILDELLHSIEVFVSRKHIRGSFQKVGSYFSETSGDTNSDYDYLFEIIDEVEITRSSSNKPFHYCIKRRNETQIVNSHKLFKNFLDYLTEFFEENRLPQGLTHGGFATQHNKFSGVRINQPAVTTLLKWRNRELSIDITPCFPIPEPEIQDLHKKEEVLDKYGVSLPSNGCLYHLVPLRPNPPGEWTITTSYLETCMLKKCDTDTRQSIILLKKIGKVISGTIPDNKFDSYSSDKAKEIAKFVKEAIDQWHKFEESSGGSETSDAADTEAVRRAIGHLLSIGHVLLPPHYREDFSEILSTEPISFNSAALKHKVLNVDPPIHPENPDQIERLLTDINENKEGSVPHTFLYSATGPYEIRLFKVACHSARNMKELLRKTWLHIAAFQLENARRNQQHAAQH